jgi:hypothetical protein
MKTAMMAACVSLLFAGPVFAAETAPQTKAPGPTFEQHKAEILTRIDERIARNQEEKSCIQAAKTPGDVKACQDKREAEMRKQRQNMKK